MGRGRSKFAGGDQAYLRDEQYRDSSRLARRADLHVKYGVSATPWFDWVARHLDLSAGDTVLEAGCGAGWLWEQSTVEVPAGVALMLTDLSTGMVDQAVDRVASTGRFQSVVGRPADLQAMPLADRTFDRIVANHMLYHLPDPNAGVSELARLVRTDGRVVVATNGRRHMRELSAIRGDVFDIERVDHTIEVFGTDVGFAILRDHFADVRWFAFADQLRCTDPADVVAYVCSTPPGEDATAVQLERLTAAIAAAFERGNGTMTITKDTGCFVCHQPIPD
jgi:SAM-dependent methyltransferase